MVKGPKNHSKEETWEETISPLGKWAGIGKVVIKVWSVCTIQSYEYHTRRKQ